MASYRCSTLVVDDEPAICQLLTQLLQNDFEIITAPSAEAARHVLAERPIDIVLTDHQLPGQSGVQLLEYVANRHPETVRIMMTGVGRLEDAVDAINCGRVHRYLFKPWKPNELLETMRQAARVLLLERSHRQMQERIQQINVELEQRVQERTRELEEAYRQLRHKTQMLKKMALTDSLTGLPNRRAIERMARQEIIRRQRYTGPLAFALVDADNFKRINTEHQLDGGDHVLAWLGQTLLKAVRNVDTVGRLGGEEFMIIAPETDVEGATILGERIRQTVEMSETIYNGVPIRITVSIGIAVVQAGDVTDFEQLRHAAAAALNEAKATGRNRCVVRVMPGAPLPDPDAVAG